MVESGEQKGVIQEQRHGTVSLDENLEDTGRNCSIRATL